MSQRSGLSALPFGSAILGLMVLSGLILQLKPLESRRQSGGQVSAEFQSSVELADARLAEDPLDAMARHFESGQAAAIRRNNLLKLSEGLPTGTGNDSAPPELLVQMRELQGLTRLRREMTARLESSPETMPAIAVSLRGDELSEAVELRRRVRTAVTSSLARRGFVATEGGNLAYVLLPFLAEKRRIGFDPYSKLDAEVGFIPVPYEIFAATDLTDLPSNYRAIVVFWLDDRFFQGVEGQAAMSELMAAAAPCSATRLAPILLGPASSSKLVQILEGRRQTSSTPGTCQIPKERGDLIGTEICTKAAELFGRLEIYSNLATAGDIIASSRAVDGIFPVLADDSQLLEAMAEELRLRSIDIDADYGPNRVVIITEIDTPYGRAMAGYLKGQLQKRANVSIAGVDTQKIWLRTYYRGIDGEGVGQAPVPVNGGNHRAAKDGSEALEEAQGRGLYDYLRRLGVELGEQDRLLRQNDQRIGAIGIFGSDYYDKQLMLQALRPFFPDAIFFTTDLDARFLHPSEQAWNRNLLIASSFDLQLSWPLQGSVPPFRDTYSTSTFLAGLLALGPCPDTDSAASPACGLLSEVRRQIRSGRAPEPLLFEIGRTTAVRLKPVQPITLSRAHPPEPAKPTYAEKAKPYLGVLCLALILPLLSTRLREKRRWLYVVGSIVLGLAAYDLVGQVFALEPAPLLEGVSSRATQLCRILILVLALAFYLRGLQKLDDSGEELRPFFSGTALSQTSESSTNEPQKNSKTGKAKPINLQESFWAISIHRAYQHLKTQSGQTVEAAEAWQRYQTLQRDGQLGNPRALRVMLYSLAAIGAGTIFVLSGLVQYPSVPIRGDGGLLADRFLRYTTLAALGLLAAWCFDVIRLASAFVNHLANGPTYWPEGSRIDEIAANKGMDRKVLGEYLDIEVITKLTESLVPIILFPFGLTALFIVSRSSVFDAWRWPWLLAWVVGTLLALVLVAATLLWRAAEKARRASLDRLEDLRLQVVAQPPKEVGASEKQLQALIAEIKANQRGAFAPWTANPLLGSLLLPFGGAGASGLLDFFVHLGL